MCVGHVCPRVCGDPVQDDASEYAFDHVKRIRERIHEVTDPALKVRYQVRLSDPHSCMCKVSMVGSAACSSAWLGVCCPPPPSLCCVCVLFIVGIDSVCFSVDCCVSPASARVVRRPCTPECWIFSTSSWRRPCGSMTWRRIPWVIDRLPLVTVPCRTHVVSEELVRSGWW